MALYIDHWENAVMNMVVWISLLYANSLFCWVLRCMSAGFYGSSVFAVPRVRRQPSYMLSSLVVLALFSFWRNLYTILISFYSIVCKNFFFFMSLLCCLGFFKIRKQRSKVIYPWAFNLPSLLTNDDGVFHTFIGHLYL